MIGPRMAPLLPNMFTSTVIYLPILIKGSPRDCGNELEGDFVRKHLAGWLMGSHSLILCGFIELSGFVLAAPLDIRV